jgi:serine/threonine-protein kinase
VAAVVEASPRRDPTRGLLRVVATPWAEVLVDGELIDVTPVGRPISLTPGKHYVTFRHPNAVEEQRVIKVAAGQTVFLDVAMRVDRAHSIAVRPDAGATASP